jgi:hypothetical protein
MMMLMKVIIDGDGVKWSNSVCETKRMCGVKSDAEPHVIIQPFTFDMDIAMGRKYVYPTTFPKKFEL